MNKSMCTSNIQTYETPNWLFQRLNSVFNFHLDVCAEDNTAKCPAYYTVKEDGLKSEWSKMNWCNPPYSRFQIEWVERAINELNKNNNSTMFLIPARVDTILWQDKIFPNAKVITFIKGRLTFEGCKNSSPFPSALILFSNELTDEQYNELSSLGQTFVLR